MNTPRTTAEQAADWLVRRDRGFTAAEQDDFHAWLATDPRHRAALAYEESTWRELDHLAEWRPEHGSEPNPDLLARPRRAPRRPLRWLVPLAAAAGLVVALNVFRPVPSSAGDTEVTGASGYEQRVLSDGSVAELNRGAAIIVDYTAGERRVRLLRGEAHFTVAKNPARPFVVNAGGIAARAVGTAFHVRLDGAAVEVLVTEGRVQVESTAAPRAASPTAPAHPILSAGERVVVPPNTRPGAPLQPIAVSAAEIDRTLAWQPRLLEFASQPLSEVVAVFNRHNAVQLRVDEAELAALPIVATFRSDNLDGFVRLLGATAGVQAERAGDTILLRRGKSP